MNTASACKFRNEARKRQTMHFPFVDLSSCSKEESNYEDLTPIFVVLFVNEQKLKMMAQEDMKTSPVYSRNDEEEPEQPKDRREVDSLPGSEDVLAHGAQPSIDFDKNGPRIYAPKPFDILLGRGRPYVTCLLVARV